MRLKTLRQLSVWSGAVPGATTLGACVRRTGAGTRLASGTASLASAVEFSLVSSGLRSRKARVERVLSGVAEGRSPAEQARKRATPEPDFCRATIFWRALKKSGYPTCRSLNGRLVGALTNWASGQI